MFSVLFLALVLLTTATLFLSRRLRGLYARRGEETHALQAEIASLRAERAVKVARLFEKLDALQSSDLVK